MGIVIIKEWLGPLKEWVSALPDSPLACVLERVEPYTMQSEPEAQKEAAAFL